MPEMSSNAQWSVDELHDARRAVFRDQAGTDPYDLDEAVAYASRNAARGTVSSFLATAKEHGETLCVPRCGVGDWQSMKDLLVKLDDAGAGFLSITVDSLTRDLRFEEARRQLESSRVTGTSSLNGFPLVAHGVAETRRMVESFDKPVIIRANAPDLRICAETGFAGGATGFVSGPMYATLEYSKKATLEEAIPKWQYIFRLMGAYQEAGVPLAEDSLGFAQSGTCSIPALMHVGVVLDALIMAAQGVKHIMPYAMLQGSISQDAANCVAVEILVQEYLARLGFHDVQTYVASSDWNGAFPGTTPDAYGLIAANVVGAAISRPPLNYVKTIQEGVGVPTAEANADSIRISRYLFRLIAMQAESLRSDEIQFEIDLSLMQARAVLDAVLDAGDGDPVVGAIAALKTGVLDIPFSPNVSVRGDVLPIRDAAGAVRFLDYGNVPIPAEARRLERERLSRRSPDTDRLSYRDVIEDLEFLELPTTSLT